MFYTVPKPTSVSSSTQRWMAFQPPLQEGQRSVTRTERGQLNKKAAELSKGGIRYFHAGWLNTLMVLWAPCLPGLPFGCPQGGISPKQSNVWHKVKSLTFPRGAVKYSKK